MEALELVTLIVDALCPALEFQRGRQAIVGKVWPSPDGSEMPLELSQADRDFLDKLLPELPEISARSDAAARSVFFKEYRAHPSRRDWEPRIADPWDVDANRDTRREIRDVHKEQLAQLLRAKRIRLFTWQGLEAPSLNLKDFMPVEDVKTYLAPLGLLAEPSPASVSGKRRTENAKRTFSTVDIDEMKAYEAEFNREAVRRKFKIGGDLALKLLGPSQIGAKRQQAKARARQSNPFNLATPGAKPSPKASKD